jgi:hypothetical protein
MVAEPVLRYEPPANFQRSSLAHLDEYSSPELNASLQIYPFRRCPGDPASLFRATLLRDWIESRFQEANVANRSFRTDTVPGASAVHTVQFLESIGLPRHRRRVMVVAGSSLAIVDALAAAHIWSSVVPVFDALLKSLRVEV